MKNYKITYFAPYTFANFSTTANSLVEARSKLDAFNDENCYCIDNREVKTETFDGKKV